MSTVSERILELKKEKGAVILAHNYTSAEVQDVADYVGDSLGLSVKASQTDAKVIVFCGVSFMGETAKILSPDKTVLLPEPEAHCPMASMCSAEQIWEIRKKYPGHAVVGYVNSTAEAKSEMDVCCTSANALNVVNTIDDRNIVFVPDKNLGAYVKSNTEKNVVLWDGFCPTHQSITVRQVERMKDEHPSAIIIAHPECTLDVLAMADHVGSTEKMVKVSKESDAEEIIILSEVGMGHRLRKECPDKKFFFPKQAICMTMKMIELESIVECLETGKGEVKLSDDVAKKAYEPVKKMTDILG